MLVETFEIEETTSEAGSLAADAEAVELIERLDLSGQKKLSNPDTLSRFPYRKMTKEEGLVYGIICPSRSTLREYSEGIIPLTVLQVAAHVTELRFCDEIEIWHAENSDIKDPILVGIKGPKYGTQERFILARWGDELPEFSILREKAIDIWRRTRRSTLYAIKAHVESLLVSCETATDLGNLPLFYP